MINKIGLVYTIYDATIFVKQNLKVNKIICLSPDSHNIIKKKFTNILTSKDIFNYDKKKELTKRLIDHEEILNKHIKEKKSFEYDYVEETFINFYLSILSCLEFIQLHIEDCENSNFYIVYKEEIIIVNGPPKAEELLLKKLINERLGIFNALRKDKKYLRFIIKFLNYFIFSYSKKNSIWLTGNIYNLPNIAKKIEKYHSSNFIFHNSVTNEFDFIKCIKSFIEIFIFRKKHTEFISLATPTKKFNNQINFILTNTLSKNLIFSKETISNYIAEICNYTYSLYDYYFKIIELNQPKLLIAHQLSLIESTVLGSIFKNKKIPVYLISHGAHRYSSDKYLNFELTRHARGLLYSKFATHFFLQQKSAKSLLEKIAITNNEIIKDKKIIHTNPIMWGNMTKQIKINNNQKEFVFLHASTFKTLSLRNLIFENSFEYLNNIKILSKIISNIPNSKLIIRARDLDECSIKTINTNLINFDNIQITRATTFEEDLSQSDCLISFSSTAIEEAIFNRIPAAIISFSNLNFINFTNKKNEKNNKIKALYYLNLKNCKDTIQFIIDNHKNRKLSDELIKDFFDIKKSKDIEYFAKNLFNF